MPAGDERPGPPTGPLPPHIPAVPAEIMDWTARVAWTAIQWLARTNPALPARLRPGHLADWHPRLAAVPVLDDLV